MTENKSERRYVELRDSIFKRKADGRQLAK